MGKGNDRIVGGPRRDRLFGGRGNDRIFGGARADRLFGGPGRDRIFGGKGGDRLFGGLGRDRLTGGPGRDILDCGPGRDRAIADAADTVRASCDVVSGVPDGPQDPRLPETPALPPIQGDFTGTLTTTVRYVSVCTGQTLSSQTTQVPSRITIRPALVPNPVDLLTGTPEQNTFNLVLGQTSAAGATAPGSLNLASAARFRFSPIQSLILQYWNLGLNGAALTGTLTQDRREEGAAFNLLAAHQELIACQPQFGAFVNQLAVAEGATLTGTVTAQQVQLRITGNTLDTFHPFVAEITATRSG